MIKFVCLNARPSTTHGLRLSPDTEEHTCKVIAKIRINQEKGRIK